MIQGNIVMGAENAADLRMKKKTAPEKSKGLKQRLKALSDVKNTLHSHSSNVTDRKNDGGKKCSSFGKKGKSSKGFTILETGENIRTTGDLFDPVGDCHNHSECEKANNLSETDFLKEYRLSKREIGFFGDRMKFFGIDSRPLKINRCVSPVEDIDFNEVRECTLSDDGLDNDVLSFEIPEPSFF